MVAWSAKVELDEQGIPEKIRVHIRTSIYVRSKSLRSTSMCAFAYVGSWLLDVVLAFVFGECAVSAEPETGPG